MSDSRSPLHDRAVQPKTTVTNQFTKASVRVHSIETELIALDVLHHQARLVNSVSTQ